ncbi:uncharacterized protein [Physcomitrium patens]|uniref:uncharacterized protein n=1 Tax=Physcomitrium patens TaxID=3218 RepID=UPI003CCE05F7
MSKLKQIDFNEVCAISNCDGKLRQRRGRIQTVLVRCVELIVLVRLLYVTKQDLLKETVTTTRRFFGLANYLKIRWTTLLHCVAAT